MSTQPTSIILGPRSGLMPGEPTASDLQHVLGKVLSVLSMRRWLFVFPLLTGMLIALVISMTLPRRYTVSTIFERRDDIVITKLISTNSPYSFGTFRRSLQIDLMGYHALDAAVEELGLTEALPRDTEGKLTPAGWRAKQQLLNSLAPTLNISMLESSDFLDLIEVRYAGADPELGVKLVEKLRDNYITTTRATITDILHKSKEFFTDQTESRRSKAAEMEAALLQLIVAHPGINPNDPDLLGQRLMSVVLAIEDLEQRRKQRINEIENRTEYLDELNGQSGLLTRGSQTQPQPAANRPVMSTRWLPNPQRQRLEVVMDQVRADIADAKALRQMTDMHPYVQGLRQKLEQLQIEFEREPDALEGPVEYANSAVIPSATPAMDPLGGERRRLNMELKTLRAALVDIEEELSRRQAEKQALEEEKGKLFERRQAFLMRQQEVQSIKTDLHVWEGHVDTVSRVLTAEEGKRGIGFATVEAARRPGHPTSPTLSGVLLLSVGLGLALGVAAVFLREIFDRSFRDPAKVRQSLGIPILETIGEIRIGSAPGWLSRQRLLPAFAGLEGMMVVMLMSLVYLSLNRPDVYARLVATLTPLGGIANALGMAT